MVTWICFGMLRPCTRNEISCQSVRVAPIEHVSEVAEKPKTFAITSFGNFTNEITTYQLLGIERLTGAVPQAKTIMVAGYEIDVAHTGFTGEFGNGLSIKLLWIKMGGQFFIFCNRDAFMVEYPLTATEVAIEPVVDKEAVLGLTEPAIVGGARVTLPDAAVLSEIVGTGLVRAHIFNSNKKMIELHGYGQYLYV